MRYCILLIIFSNICFGIPNQFEKDFVPDYEDRFVVKQTINAVISYPHLKAIQKQYEKKLAKKLRLDKADLTILGTGGMLVMQGRITTKYLKVTNIKIDSWRVRPEYQYYFNDGFYVFSINIEKSW